MAVVLPSTPLATQADLDALAARVAALEHATPIPPPVDKPSPDGTTTTALGIVLTDKYLAKWALVADTVRPPNRISYNGAVDPVTGEVTRIGVYSGGQLFQWATGGVWVADGNGAWTPTADPTVPAPVPMPGTYYRASGGQIVDPSGKPFRARGLNAPFMNWPDNQDAWIQWPLKNLPACTPLLDQFPGLNYVRLPAFYSMTQIGRAQLASLRPYLDALAAKGVVVEVECHIYPAVLTGNDLNTVCQWYASIAAAYKDVPQIIFACQNEPQDDGQGSISKMNVAIYNAIRGAGNGTLILGSGNGQYETKGLNAADFASFRNWGWGLHIYNWETGNSIDQAVINQDIANRINAFSAIHSADGATPVIVTEFGDATDGMHPDPGWQQVLNGCYHNPGSGYAQWYWNPPVSNTTGDNLIMPDGVSLTAAGQALRAAIASGA